VAWIDEVYPEEEYQRDQAHFQVVEHWQKMMSEILERPVEYQEADGVAYSLAPTEGIHARYRPEVARMLEKRQGRKPTEQEIQVVLKQIRSW
jgi:hypothetical protein